MSLIFSNGATVSRIWSDGSGEVLAQFQYFNDAKKWAERKSEEDLASGMDGQLIAVCHGTAELFATQRREPK